MTTTHARGWHPAAATAPPQGWAPPFQGPPPIPAGVNIPVSQWKSGYWQFNPNYNPQAVRPSASNWMPSQAWGTNYNAPGARNQQQSFNPYKRQPKPPSAEYLATKLSDNPLGLSNMIPAEELERQDRERQEELRRQEEEQQEAEAKSTPWVWQPRSLDDDEADLPNQSSKPHENGSSSAVHKQPRPGSAQPNGLARQNTEPVIQSSNTKDSRPSRTATDPTPISYLYAPPVKAVHTPERPAATAPVPEPFTSKGLLQPTFSRAIVCTPERYSTPTPNASQRANTYNSPSRPPTRGSSVESLTSHLSHLSTSSNSLTRHHSMPNPSNTHHSQPSHPVIDAELCEEPTEFLSPLMIPVTPKPATRSNLTRNPSGSAASLGTIPEAHSTANPSTSSRHTPQEPSPTDGFLHMHPQSRSASRPSSRHGSRSSSSHSSPYNSIPHSGEPSPISPSHAQGHSPNTAHFPPSSINTTRSGSSSRKSSISGSVSNPLPQPPAEIPFPSLTKISTPSSTSTGAKYSITVQYPQHTSPPSYIYAAPQPQPQANQNLPSMYTSPTKAHHRSSHPQSQSQLQSHKQSYKHSDSHNQPPQSSNPPLRRRRKGYWNRRGDHITETGYIVYAPPDHVYPPDLDNYPDGKEGGYMDHNGNRTRWVERPTLPNLDSYEKLIEYVYV